MTFEEFVGARLRALLRYATVVTCDPHLAEDVVQEVLTRAQQRWSQISRADQPEAYVKRMVLNEFLSWRASGRDAGRRIEHRRRSPDGARGRRGLMITDQSIRAALERMADQAPDPERIRAGLVRRTRVHRQRRALLLAGGAAAAVGVVGVPTVLTLRPRLHGHTLSGAGPVTLRYRPAWLPDHFVESDRSVTVRDGQSVYESRLWRPSEDVRGDQDRYSPAASISLSLSPEGVELSSRTAPVTVHGVEGGLFREGATLDGRPIHRVSWPAAADTFLSVHVMGIDDTDEVALRVAESVEPDGEALVEPGVEPGWIPDLVDPDPYSLVVSDSGYGVETRLSMGGECSPALSFHLGGIWAGPPVTPDQRRTETVRGTSVLLYLAEHSWSVHLVLDDGRNLVIDAGQGVSDDDLLRVWAQLRIHPAPDLRWMG